jgi:hypothetical protein
MRPRAPKQLLLLAILVFAAGPAYATSYYIDYAGGSDSNSGTTKTTPWQHAPGMNGCTATCAAASLKGGDSVILKGGVTWPAAALGWAPPSGAAGNPLYIGVDQTWYTGGSWTRPILNCGGTVCAGNNNVFISLPLHVIVDNLELTGLYWTGSHSYGTQEYISYQTNIDQEVKNVYIHGWSHDTLANGTTETSLVSGDTHIPNLNVGSSFHDSVIDGSDTDQVSGACFFGGPPTLYNNVCRYASQGFVGNGAVNIHDNVFEYIASSFANQGSGSSCPDHDNFFEDNGSEGLLFYNNVMRHAVSTTNANCSPLVTWTAPVQGYSVYMFNNVVYDVTNNNVLDFAHSVQAVTGGCPGGVTGSYCTYAGSYYFFNNTYECGPDSNPNGNCVNAGTDNTTQGSTLTNNHFISNYSPIYTCTGGCAASNIIAQTKTTAKSYSSSQTYALSPASNTGATVGTGTNVSAVCTTINAINSAAGAACLHDTTYAVSYNSANHTVGGLARTPKSRGSAWDVGAYEYSSSTSSTVEPPTGLSASVN